MKKKIIIVLACLVGITLIGFLVLRIMTKNAERHVETEKGIIVSVPQLVNAFSSSDSIANAEYLNKTLELTGQVMNVDTNQNHQSVVLLQDGPNGPGVLCTFKSMLTGIGPGKLITCKGICTGFLSNVTITDCILISIKNTIAPVKIDTIHAVNTLAPPNDSIKPSKTYTTSKAHIQFSAGGSVEDIKASNDQVEATINSTGTIHFKLAVLGFKFSDALMQEHFNDNYLESKKYSTSSFTGTISNIRDMDLLKDGTYHATVNGSLTIHGVTQKVNTTATIHILNGKMKAESTFSLKLADYKINTDATETATLDIRAVF